MNQPSFSFDAATIVGATTHRRAETPAARSSDPPSSHDAAEHVARNGSRAQQQAQTIAAIRAFPGRTMQELAELTGYCRFMLGRRVSEAELTGLIRRVPKRACAVTGRMAEPWEPAP